ncbi:MAG TPA: hypothetical protein VK486_04910 [Thermoleophilaceae bacterium]|nr:hypothetical protein [Thermoleophilaceae bacterium]
MTRIATLAAPQLEGARRESRRRRFVWIAAAALLVIGPLAFNLVRERDFRASVKLFPREVKPYPPVYDPGYYEALLADPVLREQMRLNIGQGVARYENIRIHRGPGKGPLTVEVEANAPVKAQRFVNALAPQIAGATQRQLGRVVRRDIERLSARLDSSAPGVERRKLRGRLRRLTSFGEFPPPRVLPGSAAPRPRIERWADRLVNDLPGEFRSRPSPVWAALAGLFVAVTLWLIGLAVVPPRRS